MQKTVISDSATSYSNLYRLNKRATSRVPVIDIKCTKLGKFRLAVSMQIGVMK